MQKVLKSAGFYLVLVILLIFVANTYFFNSPEKTTDIKFDKFISDVKAGKVDEVIIKDRENVIEGEYKDKREFKATYPSVSRCL